MSRSCMSGGEAAAGNSVEQRGEQRRNPMGIVKHLPVAEANDLLTHHSQLGIPSSILLECLPTAVVAIAVRLDDQESLLPKEIGDEAADGCIRRGHWQPMTTAQPQKKVLELAPSELRISRLAEIEAENLSFANCPTQSFGRDNLA